MAKEIKKNNNMKRRQEIFIEALSLLKYINRMNDTLDNIGIILDMSKTDKIAGKAKQKMFESPKKIICSALGLELIREEGFCVGQDSEHLFPIVSDVYYQSEQKDEKKRVEFSIVMDEMYSLLDIAAEDPQCALRVWNCFVFCDVESKNWLEENYNLEGMGIIQI